MNYLKNHEQFSKALQIYLCMRRSLSRSLLEYYCSGLRYFNPMHYMRLNCHFHTITNYLMQKEFNLFNKRDITYGFIFNTNFFFSPDNISPELLIIKFDK